MSLTTKKPSKLSVGLSENFIIHIIDDEVDIRLSVADYLHAAGYRCETFAGIDEFKARDRVALSGCVLLDVMLGLPTDGIDSIPTLQALAPTMPIIIMTAHGDIKMAIRALRMGAADFLEKPFSMDRLTEALGRVLERQRTVVEAQQRYARLTGREQEVMRALSRGLANKEVALEIGISPRTVEVYRAAIMTKMQLQSFAELVRLAILVGLVSDQPSA
jgi:two-component system, LuxR family, response regulator FixJ